ncbi:hypothetical protein SDC9_196352 [bioreactor metagenome]|uniref:Uncharacterized protein n=1 Tax=bioreactor metagenome TaxID=1076179 RepID=A0A645IC80_9ZZZZ
MHVGEGGNFPVKPFVEIISIQIDLLAAKISFFGNGDRVGNPANVWFYFILLIGVFLNNKSGCSGTAE